MADDYELRIIAKVQDQASAGLRGIGNAAKGSFDTIRRGASDAGGALEGMGKKAGVSAEVAKKGIVGLSLGLATLGGQSESVGGKVAGLIGSIGVGFAHGGIVSAGLIAVTGLFGLLGASAARAREEAAKAAEESKKAAESARQKAEELRRAQEAYTRSLDDTLARTLAVTDAEKRRVELAINLREAREKGTPADESAVRQIAALEATKARLDAEAAARQKISDEMTKQYEALKARTDAEVAAKIELRQQATEYVRLAGLSEDALRWESQRLQIVALQKAGLKALAAAETEILASKRAQAQQDALALVALRSRQDAAKLYADQVARVKELAAQEAALKKTNEDYLQSLRDRIRLAEADNEEARKRVQREIEIRDALREHKAVQGDILTLSKELADVEDRVAKAAKSAAGAKGSGGGGGGGDDAKPRGGGGGGGGPAPGSVDEGPMARARRIKREEAKARRNANHLANMKEEARGRGAYIDEDGAERGGFVVRDGEGDNFSYRPGDAKPRKKKGQIYSGMGGGVPPLDGNEGDEGDHPQRFGSGGKGSSSRGGAGPVVTEPGTAPPSDNRGQSDETLRKMSEAALNAGGGKAGEAAMKDIATAAGKISEAGQALGKAAEDAKGKIEEGADSLKKAAEAQDGMKKSTDDAATGVGQFVAKVEEMATSTGNLATEVASAVSRLDTKGNELEKRISDAEKIIANAGF